MVKIKGKDQADPAADAASKATKPAPDEFHSLVDRLVKVARPYSKPLAIGGAALLVVIVAGLLYSGAQTKKAGQATLELGKVLDAATGRVEDGAPDLEALTTGREPEPARFKTFKDRSEAEVAASQALDASYGGSKVARRAKLIAAGALYDLGKYDEAIAAYKVFLDSGPSADVAALAREGIGYAIEARALAQPDATARNAGLDDALKAYAELGPGEKDPGYATGLYHQARIRALKGDKAGAIELYKKIKDHNPGPLLTDEVNGRLALLDSAPEPAAPAPAPGK